jgi:hypothetical protein
VPFVLPLNASRGAAQAMAAMLQMGNLDIAGLREAYEGKSVA